MKKYTVTLPKEFEAFTSRYDELERRIHDIRKKGAYTTIVRAQQIIVNNHFCRVKTNPSEEHMKQLGIALDELEKEINDAETLLNTDTQKTHEEEAELLRYLVIRGKDALTKQKSEHAKHLYKQLTQRYKTAHPAVKKIVYREIQELQKKMQHITKR